VRQPAQSEAKGSNLLPNQRGDYFADRHASLAARLAESHIHDFARGALCPEAIPSIADAETASQKTLAESKSL
jgi:hypothetical protein